MPISLSGHNFLKLLDYTPDEIRHLLHLSKRFKNLKLAGAPHRYLEGKNIVLLFERTSIRTRCTFEVADMDLGMGVTYLDPGNSQVGAKESIADTVQVLGRTYDGIEYRGFAQKTVEELAENTGVPVWNGLTTELHLTQMIADMLIIKGNFPGSLKDLKFVFMGGTRNNVASLLMIVYSKLGLYFVACGLKDPMPEESLITQCREITEETGAAITLTNDINGAVSGAHVVYTDIWVSMGEPTELWEKHIKLLEPHRVTSQVMTETDAEVIFMHRLPSFHDTNTTISADIAEEFDVTEVEVSDEVFRPAESKVMDEVENRMHTTKAVMYTTLS